MGVRGSSATSATKWGWGWGSTTLAATTTTTTNLYTRKIAFAIYNIYK
jgi:hypothetical protein